MRSFKSTAFFLLLLIYALPCFVASAQAQSPLKVLVVMSYEKDNPWCEEIKEGIVSVLGASAEITFFYMDTKINLANGSKKAREAYELYEKIQPDGVVTADDNAQRLFVLPYLRDKVETPVMFCGVNEDPEEYGYPSTNVSGTLERGHVKESISFIRQLNPSIESVCFLAKNSPSGKALQGQVKSEKDTYLARVLGVHLITTTQELVSLGHSLDGTCDAVYIDSVEGIVDDNGDPLRNNDIIAIFSEAYRGPIIGANYYHVTEGALSAVVKTGQEQGETAARMLLQAMRGISVSDLPITRNYMGRRVINVTTMDALGIMPRPIILRGVTLVRTTP